MDTRKQLLKEINGYNMYQKVIDDYGMDPRYQKDGKPNILKLKEEAIAKARIHSPEWKSLPDNMFIAKPLRVASPDETPLLGEF